MKSKLWSYIIPDNVDFRAKMIRNTEEHCRVKCCIGHVVNQQLCVVMEMVARLTVVERTVKSLWCIPETNTTVCVNYTSIKKRNIALQNDKNFLPCSISVFQPLKDSLPFGVMKPL